MPSLLVPNDDGVHAPGLAALEAALAELGDAYVLAPEREQSACGHALTLHRPLRVDRLGERRFGGDGTPPPCGNPRVLGVLRSEEDTSEPQSQSKNVFRPLP